MIMPSDLRQLAAAIILQALRDSQKREYRYEVKLFFEGEWFEELAEAVKINPEIIRKKLK